MRTSPVSGTCWRSTRGSQCGVTKLPHTHATAPGSKHALTFHSFASLFIPHSNGLTFLPLFLLTLRPPFLPSFLPPFHPLFLSPFLVRFLLPFSFPFFFPLILLFILPICLPFFLPFSPPPSSPLFLLLPPLLLPPKTICLATYHMHLS